MKRHWWQLALALTLLATVVLAVALWWAASSSGIATPRKATWPTGGPIRPDALPAPNAGSASVETGDARGQASFPPGPRDVEAQLSREALSATSARQLVAIAARLPRASLAAHAAFDAVDRACDPDQLSVSVEDSLAAWTRDPRNSSDPESRQAFLESLAIRRQFCGEDPAVVWQEARRIQDSREFTRDLVAQAPDRRFDFAFRMNADESLLDAAATLDALDVAPDLGYESAATLPAEMRAAVDRIVREIVETGDPIMRLELLQRLTTHRAVAEASGLFGDVRGMRQMDWVNVSAEERRIATQQWAAELYVCRSLGACGPGSAFGLRYIQHSPFAARGYEAYRREQIPPLIWRQVDELARTIEAQMAARARAAAAGGP